MFVKVINGVVESPQYSIGELQKDNPQTSFPEKPTLDLLADWGVYPVKATQIPQIDHTKNIKEGTPIFQDGWIQTWVVTDATPEEISTRINDKAKEIRSIRDQLLIDSDWTQIADVPVDKAAWAIYRQSLRDIPAQSGFPWAVQWPTQP
jgi:hypothetical protein